MLALVIGCWADLGGHALFGQDSKRNHNPKGGVGLCRVVELAGEAEKGKEWSAPIGEGWVFRVMPMKAPEGESQKRDVASGWDLVLDRVGDEAGYPDALLLATPPYGSLNEREIGTTFGLRAQDALGWEPRRFRFLDSMEQLSEARKLFRVVTGAGSVTGPATKNDSKQEAGRRLMMLIGKAASGEFRVTDSKLVPGQADPKGFAQRWGANLPNVPHTVMQQSNEKSELGEIRWIQFEVRLWLPEKWKTAASHDPKSGSKLAKCAQ